MVMELQNNEYAFACRIDNVKEAAHGNRVISGCTVEAQGTPDMSVYVDSGAIRINNKFKFITTSGVVTIDTADATNDRYDIIEANDSGELNYISGTVSANPMPPNLSLSSILLSTIFVENNATTIETVDIEDQRIVYADSGIQIPIGGILAWAKTLTGMPSLPLGFVECDGSVLSDSDSPLNGITLPDLNSTQRFLRGAGTSGGTGGSDTHTLTTDEMPSHNHTGSTILTQSTGVVDGTTAVKGVNSTDGSQSVSVASQGGGSAHENRPAYYEVVWIIRVK